MSGFNFIIKNQTYLLAINKAQEALKRNEIETGTDLTKQAISLGKEIIKNTTIPEVKEKYIKEMESLNKLLLLLEKGKNPFSQTQNKNMPINTSNTEFQSNFFKNEIPSITLNDVAGLKEVKKAININILTPLNHPDIYFRYKDEVGCRILMYGPPGCGKSFVAEAIAGELKCKYAILNCSDFLDKYVGIGPQKMKVLFNEANKLDKCLIFLDELDSLFSSREDSDSTHTKDILTTFLTCLSGFGTSKNSNKLHVIIGATNRPWSLDPALLRGKRFDTSIYVGLPDNEARTFIIKKEFKGHEDVFDNSDASIDDIINRSEGYSGADLVSIINKIKDRSIERELSLNRRDCIRLDDIDTIFSEYRNPINKEMLDNFLLFKEGKI